MRGVPNFDRLAHAYRWLEYLSFGRSLERCRFFFLPELSTVKHVLALGDGDGRFLARLLAANSTTKAEAVDASGAMLRLLKKRAASVGCPERLRTQHCSVQEFQPSGTKYDLVVAHFFFDCLTDRELQELIARLSPFLTEDARWIVSEFAIPPEGWRALAARLLIASLYAAFRWLTGLQVRKIPDYRSILEKSGFQIARTNDFLRGLLRSELWRRV